jgi:uncharacterized protein (TIGR00255 family)
MTGYARVQRATEQGDITVSLKSVNHKGLDLHFHLDSSLDPFEGALRAVLKKAIMRGHVDVRCVVAPAGPTAAGGLNAPLLRACLESLRKAARDEGLDVKPDLNQLIRLPGMFGNGAAAEPASPDVERPLLALLEEAIEMLNRFRSREGGELGDFVRAQNQAIAAGANEMAEIRARAIPAFQNRLTEKLNELLRNSNFDPQRIAQEAALLADRSDIGEEIARLQIHSRQLDEILNAGGEAGKKLDFLLQEMNRETNTILSKTNGIGELGLRITDLALAAKASIEKIREQALNLE